MKNIISIYTHLELGQDIAAPAGYYTPQKEARIKVDGREVLYVLSQAVIDASCCGVADFASALVPGYIVKWRAQTDNNGLPVSEVEPIQNEQARELVRKIIRERENINEIEFW